MPEPKRLTADELSYILSLISEDIRLFPREVDALCGHIAALDTELAAAHDILRELVTPEKIGIDDSAVYAECLVCGRLAMTNLCRDVEHAPDCPIVRGRALVREAK